MTLTVTVLDPETGESSIYQMEIPANTPDRLREVMAKGLAYENNWIPESVGVTWSVANYWPAADWRAAPTLAEVTAHSRRGFGMWMRIGDRENEIPLIAPVWLFEGVPLTRLVTTLEVVPLDHSVFANCRWRPVDAEGMPVPWPKVLPSTEGCADAAARQLEALRTEVQYLRADIQSEQQRALRREGELREALVAATADAYLKGFADGDVDCRGEGPEFPEELCDAAEASWGRERSDILQPYRHLLPDDYHLPEGAGTAPTKKAGERLEYVREIDDWVTLADFPSCVWSGCPACGAASTAQCSSREGTELALLVHRARVLAASDDKFDAECPACGGAGMSLGALGQREHFRCRDCGADFSAEKIPDEDDEATEQELLGMMGMPNEDEP